VTELARDIDSLGHDAWLDHELSGGQRWWDQILGEIRACDVFAFAISSSALDSRACNSEYEYATALGKPVLPVAVCDDFTDGLMDPALAAVQRVNYTSRDKVAFAALNRALSTVATAPELPATLPPEPPVPASYLFDLKTEIAAPGGMGAEKQDEILRQFQTRLDEGHVQQDVLVLIRRFRQRSDLLVRVDREAASLEARLTDAAQAAPQRQPSSNTPPPQEAVQQPATPVAAAVMPPPVAATAPAASAPYVAAGAQPAADVSAWWWVAPILFGLIGGFVAWLVNKDVDAATAKNMLIAGVVSSVIWFFLVSSG
jgi:hypothetical protein